MSNNKALIVGGGLSGLTAALTLNLHGWTVTVLEKAPELREIGAGLYTWENGLKCFEKLGLGEELFDGIEFLSALEMINDDGKMMHATQFGPESRFCVIPRVQVHSSLAAKAQRDGIQIRTNARVIDVTSDGSVSLDNGETVRGDLVIGCDGVGSCVRQQLNFNSTLETVQNGAIRTLIPRRTSDKRNIAQEHWCRKRRIGIAPVNTQYMYVFFTARTDDYDALGDEFQPGVWKESFPHLSDVIDRASDVRIDTTFNYVYARNWTVGKVAIVGDAAHCMEPNLGQGAGTSIVSAMELAERVSHQPFDDALAAWEKSQRPLIEQTQMMTRIYGAISSNWPDELLGARPSIISSAFASDNVDAMVSAAARYTVDII